MSKIAGLGFIFAGLILLLSFVSKLELKEEKTTDKVVVNVEDNNSTEAEASAAVSEGTDDGTTTESAEITENMEV